MAETDKHKKCSKCKIVKPLSEYHKLNKERWRSDCRVCRKIKNAECYKKRKAIAQGDNNLCKTGVIALVSPVS